MASKVPAATQTLQILALLSDIEVPISAARIHAELGIPRSTTYHLLSVMRDAGFVTYLPETRTYGLGVAAYSMACAYTTQQPLVRATARHAKELARAVGGSAHVGKLVSGEVVYLLEERAPGAVSLVTDVGVRLPAIRTASGRALLAKLPEMELKTVHRLVGQGRFSVWSQPVVQARQQGWGAEVEQVSAGQQSLAVAVTDHLGRPAASLAVTFPVDHEIDHAAVVAELSRRAGVLETALFGR